MSKSNSAIYQKISEKRANLEKLREFKNLTNDLANELERIGDQLETMKDGTESIASIMKTWQSVIQSINLASIGLLRMSEDKLSNEMNLPEPLVRINLIERDKKGEEEEEEEM
ncbi:DAD2 [Candida oxycetoniae]|uniref:DASH complex subunit DAD2 n=1 Tax=Candida oxycetoniae TaxID=497107 RepID=A0AAI9WXU6_9ASCO|nr:DAD2 [Candida oxycetoniae]KAI3404364.2 DAD2 [Candida oxycetoniae]